jgi:hypothetical protein
MRWRKRGLVWGPDGSQPWARTHASVPTPVLLNDGEIRVFFGGLDSQGRSRPAFVDVSAADPTRVVRVSAQPLMDLGVPGTFDDNGVMPVSVLRGPDGTLMMYYAGFELGTRIRYRIFTGLAVSEDDGQTFRRHARTPVLDRSDQELFFRCAPFVLHEDGVFRLWYVAGSEWTEVGGKALPVYDLRYQESVDGIRWAPEGRRSLRITGDDEHGFGRPWVVKHAADDYRLFYSIRRRSLGAYRLGYARSRNGVDWERQDQQLGLDVSADGFDSDAMMYSAVITTGGRTFCFYNGNNFGERGFGLAELVEE